MGNLRLLWAGEDLSLGRRETSCWEGRSCRCCNGPSYTCAVPKRRLVSCEYGTFRPHDNPEGLLRVRRGRDRAGENPRSVKDSGLLRAWRGRECGIVRVTIERGEVGNLCLLRGG